MIKGSIKEKDVIIVNIYALNIGASQYIRQILTAIQGEIDSNTIIMGNYNTPISSIDRSSRIDHILGHKSSLSKFKKIEIISSIFSDHNAMRLEMKDRKSVV